MGRCYDSRKSRHFSAMNKASRFFRSASTLVLCMTLSSCLTGVTLVVKNESGSTISHVQVAGNGFSRTIESLASGQQKRLVVWPKGDSGLTIVYAAAGSSYTCDPDLYLTHNLKAEFHISIGRNHDCDLIAYRFGSQPLQKRGEGEWQ